MSGAPLTDLVTVLRAPLAEGYSGKFRDWDNAVPRPDRPANVYPQKSTELLDGRQVTISRWLLFMGADEDLEDTDRVVWEGNTYEVEGEVEVWKRRGSRQRVAAVLTRIKEG